MLVLSRRQGEKIVIGNEVVIEVLSISGESVRLGITAPSETSIHRFEVFTEIEGANRAAENALNAVEQETLESLAAQIRKNQEQ